MTKPRTPGGATEPSTTSSPSTHRRPVPEPTLPPPPGTAALRRWLGPARTRAVKMLRQARESRLSKALIGWFASWRAEPYSGTITLVVGTALVTALLILVRRMVPAWPNPGVAYLPLIAMLAYYWSWRLGVAATALQLICVYVLFLPHELTLQPRAPQDVAELLVLVAVSGYILGLVQLATRSRDAALREARRFAALNAVGIALAGEHDRDHLLQLIARIACELTGAGFAAFTLRPLDPSGQPLVPPEGSRFHLAAVVGVSPEQEALFRRLPLGGVGLLAPIFQQGVPVRVADAAEVAAHMPREHPMVRSFLGAPLLARDLQVRGGLLLGHSLPGRFTESDENVLQALAAQAAVALENTRLYQAAQDQARELTTVFQSIADAVVVYDPEGNLRHENPAGAEVRRLLALHQVDSGTGGQAMTPEAAGIRLSNLPISLVDDLGERRYFLVSASSLRAEGATGDTAVGSGDGDDSGQGRSSPAQETPEDRGKVVVWHEVTEARKLLALKEAEHLKDEFIAMAAHELKTPMASVKGYAGMLLRQSVGEEEMKLADWQIEALETIDQATNRLVELTDDLLDVARLQSDHLQLHPEPHDLIALARRVMKRFQIVSGHHTLSLSATAEFVVACIDVRRTEQIIGNLLSNAIKYSPQGGPVRISIQQDEQAGMSTLSIADQGIGIPEDQQTLLFNRFARAENARELGITGTGLGLYLCRELVERQGGHIWFTSKAGAGSTFSVSLPLAASEESTVE